MKLRTHYSLSHAYNVLRAVRVLARRSRVNVEVHVDCWAHGREQGYHLSGARIGVCFAQQRCSDQVLVLAGPSHAFHISTNMPNDELWPGRCFNDDLDAAKCIVELLEADALQALDATRAAALKPWGSP